MTEPETFEDDLFADLYTDDEPAKAPAAPAQLVASNAAASALVEDSSEPTAGSSFVGNADSHMNEEEEDDDDDVDFNLGNGAASHHTEAVAPYTPTPAAPAPASSSSSRGPNSKEDG